MAPMAFAWIPSEASCVSVTRATQAMGRTVSVSIVLNLLCACSCSVVIHYDRREQFVESINITDSILLLILYVLIKWIREVFRWLCLCY